MKTIKPEIQKKYFTSSTFGSMNLLPSTNSTPAIHLSDLNIDYSLTTGGTSIYNHFLINTQAVYALIDCNQFYVSCERVFAPYLKNQPVGVLSNNDGCLVALSPELKSLGITRGTPAFQIPEKINGHKVFLFSSNYELYGDMSTRVMNILSSFSDSIEIYSIDEAFLLFKNVHESINLYEYGFAIRETVMKATGIPISIGFAKTKTLAKIANKIAKKTATGVFTLVQAEQISNILKKIEVTDIWGVGRQHSKRLNKIGIYSAYDFVQTPISWVRKEMAVNGERTQLELKGIPCLDMEYASPQTKSIVCSRSFGKPVCSLNELIEAVSQYTSNAVQNLRYKSLVARQLTVFITTNPFKDTKQYANFQQGKLADYSAYTPDFIHLAISLLKEIFKETYLYKKTGVMLTDFIKQERIQPDLFNQPYGTDRRHNVMLTVDKINARYGKNKIFFASDGIKNNWSMKREMVSQRYTTRWNELLIVK